MESSNFCGNASSIRNFPNFGCFYGICNNNGTVCICEDGYEFDYFVSYNPICTAPIGVIEVLCEVSLTLSSANSCWCIYEYLRAPKGSLTSTALLNLSAAYFFLVVNFAGVIVQHRSDIVFLVGIGLFCISIMHSMFLFVRILSTPIYARDQAAKRLFETKFRILHSCGMFFAFLAGAVFAIVMPCYLYLAPAKEKEFSLLFYIAYLTMGISICFTILCLISPLNFLLKIASSDNSEAIRDARIKLVRVNYVVRLLGPLIVAFIMTLVALVGTFGVVLYSYVVLFAIMFITQLVPAPFILYVKNNLQNTRVNDDHNAPQGGSSSMFSFTSSIQGIQSTAVAQHNNND